MKKIMPHKQENLMLAIRKFLEHITQTFGCLTPLTATLLDYCVRGAVEQEMNKTPCNIKVELKARITVAFISLNKETVEKACKRF